MSDDINHNEDPKFLNSKSWVNTAGSLAQISPQKIKMNVVEQKLKKNFSKDGNSFIGRMLSQSSPYKPTNEELIDLVSKQMKSSSLTDLPKEKLNSDDHYSKTFSDFNDKISEVKSNNLTEKNSNIIDQRVIEKLIVDGNIHQVMKYLERKDVDEHLVNNLIENIIRPLTSKNDDKPNSFKKTADKLQENKINPKFSEPSEKNFNQFNDRILPPETKNPKLGITVDEILGNSSLEPSDPSFLNASPTDFMNSSDISPNGKVAIFNSSSNSSNNLKDGVNSSMRFLKSHSPQLSNTSCESLCNSELDRLYSNHNSGKVSPFNSKETPAAFPSSNLFSSNDSNISELKASSFERINGNKNEIMVENRALSSESVVTSLNSEQNKHSENGSSDSVKLKTNSNDNRIVEMMQCANGMKITEGINQNDDNNTLDNEHKVRNLVSSTSTEEFFDVDSTGSFSPDFKPNIIETGKTYFEEIFVKAIEDDPKIPEEISSAVDNLNAVTNLLTSESINLQSGDNIKNDPRSIDKVGSISKDNFQVIFDDKLQNKESNSESPNSERPFSVNPDTPNSVDSVSFLGNVMESSVRSSSDNSEKSSHSLSMAESRAEILELLKASLSSDQVLGRIVYSLFENIVGNKNVTDESNLFTNSDGNEMSVSGFNEDKVGNIKSALPDEHLSGQVKRLSFSSESEINVDSEFFEAEEEVESGDLSVLKSSDSNTDFHINKNFENEVEVVIESSTQDEEGTEHKGMKVIALPVDSEKENKDGVETETEEEEEVEEEEEEVEEEEEEEEVVEEVEEEEEEVLLEEEIEEEGSNNDEKQSKQLGNDLTLGENLKNEIVEEAKEIKMIKSTELIAVEREVSNAIS